MVAMLPSAFTGLLGIVGLGASSGAVAALSPALSTVNRPLLLVSTALLAVTGLRCSRAVVGSAVAGGALLYLSMYVVAQSDGTSSPILFYTGLALFLGTYVIAWAQRRRLRCRPLVNVRVAKRLLAGTVVGGVAVVIVAACVGTALTAPEGGRGSRSGHPSTTTPGHTMPGMSTGGHSGSMSGMDP
ncbi:MAG: hypothetical protein ACRDL4_00605 [Thermoleophilaceae bacterium]